MDRPADFVAGEYHINKRPGLQEFLSRCVEWFTVGVWTSSSTAYGGAVVPQLFTKPEDLGFVWTRQRCVQRFDPTMRNYFWIKDLKKLKKKYPFERILMIDDPPKKLLRNYGNHILVREWTGDLADRELEALLTYLEESGPAENVRAIEKRGWQRRNSS